MVLVEHDMRLVMGISDHILVLREGASSPKARPDVRSNAKVIEAYLGVNG